MNKAIVIFDYNNVFCTNSNLTRETRESILRSVLLRIAENHPTIDFIDVRIYGGWYHELTLTQAGSRVMEEHGSMELFPLVFEDRLIRGRQTVVDSIYGVNYVWYNTYRERDGLPRIILKKSNMAAKCNENKPYCPIHIISSFSKTDCRICAVDGCMIQSNQAFVQMGQKMVDAMMVCDIVSLSEDDDTHALYILTDDVDLFPALAKSRVSRPDISIVLGIVNGRNVEPYREYLKPFQIDVFQVYDKRRT